LLLIYDITSQKTPQKSLFSSASHTTAKPTPPPPIRSSAAIEYKEEADVNIKKEEEEEDVKVKLEDDDDDIDDHNDDENNSDHGDADVELLRVMKVELECNHSHSRNAVGSTMTTSRTDGTPRCSSCGIFIHTDRANSCHICDGVFCLSHKFSKRGKRRGKKNLSSSRASRPHLPLFIQKLEINKYISKCNPRLGFEPRVEALSTWAEGVFLASSAGEKETVPQAVLKMVYDKWESQEF
jgi:hypothetical protein